MERCGGRFRDWPPFMLHTVTGPFHPCNGWRVDRILGGGRPSSLRDISAVLTLDNRILTVEPLRVGLLKGAITGKLVVNQRNGQPVPRVIMALDMADSSIGVLAGGDDGTGIDGRVDARVRLTGMGSTIGIVARQGMLPAKIAALIGFDIRRGLLGVPGYLTARGTIRAPEIVVPERTRSVGNVLKAIGRAIAGHDAPRAVDADCGTLSRRALGG